MLNFFIFLLYFIITVISFFFPWYNIIKTWQITKILLFYKIKLCHFFLSEWVKTRQSNIASSKLSTVLASSLVGVGVIITLFVILLIQLWQKYNHSLQYRPSGIGGDGIDKTADGDVKKKLLTVKTNDQISNLSYQIIAVDRPDILNRGRGNNIFFVNNLKLFWFLFLFQYD